MHGFQVNKAGPEDQQSEGPPREGAALHEIYEAIKLRDPSQEQAYQAADGVSAEDAARKREVAEEGSGVGVVEGSTGSGAAPESGKSCFRFHALSRKGAKRSQLYLVVVAYGSWTVRCEVEHQEGPISQVELKSSETS